MKKHFIIKSIFLSIFFIFVFVIPVFASIKFPVQTNIPLDKVFKITFNHPVDPSSIQGRFDIMIANNGILVDLTPIIDPNDNKSVLVKHSEPFKANEDYTLSINNVKNTSGKSLIDHVILNFYTITTINIVSISNITNTITQGDSYSLPLTVEAIMSDGSKKNVNVIWNPSTVDTNDIGLGLKLFKGSVEGYDKVVSLSLFIEEKSQTIEDMQKLLLGKWVTSDYKRMFEFNSNGTAMESTYMTSSWYTKDEINYILNSPTNIKLTYIRWYDSLLDKWFTNGEVKTINIKVSDNELRLLNWSKYGDLVLKRF